MIASDDLRALLAAGEVDGCCVRFPQPLDRRTYQRLDAVLVAAGGRWSRKDNAHVFEGEAQAVIDRIVATGRIDPPTRRALRSDWIEVLRAWRAALHAGHDDAWAPTMVCWRVRQLFEAAGLPLEDPPLPGPPEHRSLLDALLEDAEEHRAAGRVMQAANALAAVENLRTMPPWQPSIADVAPMVSGGPPVSAEDDIEEGGL